MTKRWTKVVERLARAVGYTTKSARAERLAATQEEAREQREHGHVAEHVAEENERAGRRYLRP